MQNSTFFLFHYLETSPNYAINSSALVVINPINNDVSLNPEFKIKKNDHIIKNRIKIINIIGIYLTNLAIQLI
jgi:hypothetical protein